MTLNTASCPNTPAPAGNLLVSLTSILEPLRFEALFPVAQPVEVELGAGDGSFLIEHARRNPGRNYLGVERLMGRLRKIDRKGRRAGLANVLGVRLEADYLVQYLLPPGSVDAFHIYFPDPWPKRKHWQNRLIKEGFPARAHAALAPGGRVYLRTDDADYFAQMQCVFGASPLFRAVETPPGLLEVKTDFEREFNARGIPTRAAAYARGESLRL